MERDTFIAELRRLIGAEQVLCGEAAAAHTSDWRGRYHGAALAVALPGSTEEVAAVVQLCAQAGVAVDRHDAADPAGRVIGRPDRAAGRRQTDQQRQQGGEAGRPG